MMGEVLCLIDLNSFFFFFYRSEFTLFPFSLFVLVKKEEKKSLKLFRMTEEGEIPPLRSQGGCLTSILCVSLNEAFQHRDAVTSCTARKHCRIAPYRSLILNVPVFSQLLKVCMLDDLYSLRRKVHFFLLLLPPPPRVTSSF